MKNPFTAIVDKWKHDIQTESEEAFGRILVKVGETLPVLAAFLAGKKVEVKITVDADIVE